MKIKNTQISVQGLKQTHTATLTTASGGSAVKDNALLTDRTRKNKSSALKEKNVIRNEFEKDTKIITSGIFYLCIYKKLFMI